jgi:hypothetical protein
MRRRHGASVRRGRVERSIGGAPWPARGGREKESFQFDDKPEISCIRRASIGSTTYMGAPESTIEVAEYVDRWPVAIRLAGAMAVLAAAVAYALSRFMHVGAVPLLVLGAIFGLAVGTRLPAAAPALLRASPSLDEELEALLGEPDGS